MHDPDMVELIERSLRGGFCTSNAGCFTANNKYMTNYDPQIPTKYIIYADFNGLYPSRMVFPIIHSKMRYLNDEEIKKFNLNQKNSNSVGFFVECDFEIPPDVALHTDDLPLGMHHMDISLDDLSPHTKQKINEINCNFKPGRRLVATHFAKKNYLTTLPLLQLYMELGVQVTAVKNIITFEQKDFFKNYVERNIALRKQSKSSFKSQLFKSLSNMSFGKCILNKRNRSIKHRIVKTQAVFEKYCADPFLQRIIDIGDDGEDYCVFVSACEEIVLDQPLQVGFQILESSKLLMYTFFYKVVKRNYGDKVKLLYSDTDSLILGFTGVEDIYHEMKWGPLADHMDLSNYNPDSPFYDNSRKGSFGFLKDELGGKVITEAICLLPKSYSLLTEDHAGVEKQLLAAKGVQYSERKNLKHKVYRDILEGKVRHVMVNNSNIRSKNFELYTTHTKKVGLSNIDVKRYHLTNTKSVAFGHPVCNNVNKRARDVDDPEQITGTGKKCKIV